MSQIQQAVLIIVLCAWSCGCALKCRQVVAAGTIQAWLVLGHRSRNRKSHQKHGKSHIGRNDHK